MNPCSNPPPSALYAHGSAEAANPNPSSLQPPPKKKRSLPGTPDPEAEVVALSPRSLMATNRFVCEVCGKGFQRDQNLQLHRRGHNLPWRLRQRKEVPRKKVYVCPVEACVHHEPARALGDLTGIKKHYSRKHGEKKWKCHKCSKRYAVQSDWKAHSKNCGTREYACDCGTVFSRKDSFVTHRAFCDALVQETAKLSADAAAEANHHLSFSQPQPPLGNADAFNRQYSTQPPILDVEHKGRHSLLDEHQHLGMMPPLPNSGLMIPQVLSMDEASMYLSDHIITEAAAGSPCGLSATALLQKAAQMGSATSPASSTLFAGLGGTFPALQRPPLLLAPFPSMGEQQGPLGQSATADGVDGNNSWSTGGSGSAAEGELGSGFTRDFLGVGGAEEDCLKRSFVPELAGFDGMCSAIDAFRSSLGYR